MTNLVIIKVKKSAKKDPLIQTFNRLKNNIAKAENQVQKLKDEFDECLLFDLHSLEPKKLAILQLTPEKIKQLHTHYKSFKLPKKIKDALHFVLQEDLNDVLSALGPSIMDDELKNIYRDILNSDFDKDNSGRFEHFKEDMAKMFSEDGLHPDFSDVTMEDDPQTVFEKLFSSLDKEDIAKAREKFFSEQKKTKQEEVKEQKDREKDSLLKRGINNLYKQLAKFFHPDLEYNPDLKREKEELMKELTSAYKENDFVTLLSLERKWLQQSGGKKPMYAEEDLKVYNKLLEHQLRCLKEDKNNLIFEPKYRPLQRYQRFGFFGGLRAMRYMHEELKQEEANTDKLIKQLRNVRSKDHFLEILDEYFSFL